MQDAQQRDRKPGCAWVGALLWDARERRLRMPWRLACLGLLWAVGRAVLQAAVVAVGVPWLFWPGLVGITLGAVAAVSAALERRSMRAYGLRLDRLWWKELALGLGLGAVLMTLVYAAQLAAGWAVVVGAWHAPQGTPFLLALAEPVLIFVCVGIYEEVLFRGYLLRNLAESLPLGRRRQTRAWGALLLASVLFGVAHIGNPGASLTSTLGVSWGGLVLGLAYALTGRLGLPIGIHITWNLVQGHVFGFPVSGTVFGQATVLVVRRSGPTLWTGGDFGPEAGLLGALALLLGAAAVWAWVRWRYGRADLSSLLGAPDGVQHGL